MHKIKGATIYHEDCIIAFNKLKDDSVDFIATDPPYFLDGMGNEWSDKDLNKRASKAEAVGGLPVGMKFDPQQGKRLEIFFRNVSDHSFRVLKPGAFMVAFSQPRLAHRMAVAAEDAGFEIRDTLIWEHNGGQGKAFTQNHFVNRMNISDNQKERIIQKLDNRKTPQIRPKFETIILAQKPKQGTYVDNWLKWKTGLVKIDFEGELQQTTILRYNKPGKEEQFEHMTVKPIDLMQRLIEMFTVEGQVVLDPFLGSGTTGIAALKSHRQFIGFEIEKRYVDLSVKRIKELQ